LFRTDDTPDPAFGDTLALDLGSVVPSLAGPKRPQDRVPLTQAKTMYQDALRTELEAMSVRAGGAAAVAAAAPQDRRAMARAVMVEEGEGGGQPQHPPRDVVCELNGERFALRHGAVV